MMTWQTMETAPRDGSPILAYNPLVGVYNTAFTTRFTGKEDERPYEGFPCGFWGGGTSYPFGSWDCKPTHWMPLPAPPTT